MLKTRKENRIEKIDGPNTDTILQDKQEQMIGENKH
jgi:hypothetical protein